MQGPKVELQRGVDVGGGRPDRSSRGCRRVGIGGRARAWAAGGGVERRAAGSSGSSGTTRATAVARVARVVVDVELEVVVVQAARMATGREGGVGDLARVGRRRPGRPRRPSRGRGTRSAASEGRRPTRDLSPSRSRGARRAARASGADRRSLVMSWSQTGARATSWPRRPKESIEGFPARRWAQPALTLGAHERARCDARHRVRARGERAEERLRIVARCAGSGAA